MYVAMRPLNEGYSPLSNSTEALGFFSSLHPQHSFPCANLLPDPSLELLVLGKALLHESYVHLVHAGELQRLLQEWLPELDSIPTAQGRHFVERNVGGGGQAPKQGRVLPLSETDEVALEFLDEIVLGIFPLKCARQLVVFNEFLEPGVLQGLVFLLVVHEDGLALDGNGAVPSHGIRMLLTHDGAGIVHPLAGGARDEVHVNVVLHVETVLLEVG